MWPTMFFDKQRISRHDKTRVHFINISNYEFLGIDLLKFVLSHHLYYLGLTSSEELFELLRLRIVVDGSYYDNDQDCDHNSH